VTSRESQTARYVATQYGQIICARTRAQRITYLENKIIDIKQIMIEQSNEHETQCEACRSGDFCLARVTISPHYQDLNFYRTAIELELADAVYAARAKIRPVQYADHVDGFCMYWQNVRHRLFVVANHKCQRCLADAPLQAHHRHYRTLGFEEINDLEALCGKCHPIADVQRMFNSAYHTYAMKKYGDDPNEWPEYLDDEFAEWWAERQ
jgi:hypothetical protein